jgi:hypothetical protein
MILTKRWWGSLSIGLILFLNACPKPSEDNHAEKCSEDTVRVGDVCKDLNSDDPPFDPPEVLDGGPQETTTGADSGTQNIVTDIRSGLGARLDSLAY